MGLEVEFDGTEPGPSGRPLGLCQSAGRQLPFTSLPGNAGISHSSILKTLGITITNSLSVSECVLALSSPAYRPSKL